MTNRERTWEVYEQLIEQIGAKAVADGLAQYFNTDEVNGALHFIEFNHKVSLEQLSAETVADGLAKYFNEDAVNGALHFIAFNHKVNLK